jgi:hypothetical protein
MLKNEKNHDNFSFTQTWWCTLKHFLKIISLSYDQFIIEYPLLILNEQGHCI